MAPCWSKFWLVYNMNHKWLRTYSTSIHQTLGSWFWLVDCAHGEYGLRLLWLCNKEDEKDCEPRFQKKRLLACNGKPQKEEFWSRAALDQNFTGEPREVAFTLLFITHLASCQISRLQVFINPLVASLPEHAHLLSEVRWNVGHAL